MTVAQARRTTIWSIYSWPGGRWLVVAWSCSPGSPQERGPLLWETSLESARARVPAGLERRDPPPEDAEASPALMENWF
jgi:hypothetical protein